MWPLLTLVPPNYLLESNVCGVSWQWFLPITCWSPMSVVSPGSGSSELPAGVQCLLCLLAVVPPNYLLESNVCGVSWQWFLRITCWSPMSVVSPGSGSSELPTGVQVL